MGLRLIVCLVGMLAALVASGVASAQSEIADGSPLVLVTPVEGAIGPPTARHLVSTIATAEEKGAALLVLRMDTPGGLVSSTRDINRAILASEVPVAVHVAPAGARAASAGTYILYAAHVAAMTPGSNLGAATPVEMGGGSPGEGGSQSDDAQDSGEALEAKRVEDAVASIRALAELRGRNADWAERAVREAATLTAREAVERNVVEHVVGEVQALLSAANGRTVTVNGQERTLQLAEAKVQVQQPSLVTRILSVLANPNVALLMMTLGFYGLLYELASPGLGPGIAGAILMLLGLYSLNTLPVNYAGIALILLGLLLLAAEALSPSFGVVGFGGVISFGIGAAILMDTNVAAFQVSPGIVVTLCVMSGAVVGTRRLSLRASSGEMIDARAEILSWENGRGQVRAHGERWRAVGPDDLVPGEAARVSEVEGLTLHLRRP